MIAYLRFEVRRVLRDRRYVFFTIALPIVLYLLYTHVDGGGNSIGGTDWATYFMVSMAAYGAMVGAISATAGRLAGERAAGWTSQLRATPLPGYAYLVVKLLAALLLALPVVLAIAVVGGVFNGVHLEAARWAGLIVMLWLGSLPFAGLGVLLGYLLDGASAQPATVGLNLALALLGGLWAPLRSLPQGMRTFAHLLPSYHFADLGWRAVVGAMPTATDVLALAGYAVAFGALAIWRYRRSAATI
ncbi:MAG TPA: ABC transporter permease [Actinomycetota bacterium]|jgi:ABC-2 type transport system permease protein|nr:ABC transporter permease [Actinomycetota bacterium]